MFEEFRIALWLTCNFHLSGELSKSVFVRSLTVVMVDGEDDGYERSIPLTAVINQCFHH